MAVKKSRRKVSSLAWWSFALLIVFAVFLMMQIFIIFDLNEVEQVPVDARQDSEDLGEDLSDDDDYDSFYKECSYDLPDELWDENLYQNAKHWVDTRHMSGIQIAKEAHPKLVANGFVLLRGVLDPAVVSRLRKHIVGKYGDQAKLELEEWYDYPLDLEDGIVRESLSASVKRLSLLYKNLVGEEGHMVELACIWKCYSPFQGFHHDVEGTKNPALLYPKDDCGVQYSTFLALQPTPDYLGATRLVNGTHLEKEFIEFFNPNPGMNHRSSKSIIDATLGPGDVLIYNNLLVHAAGENFSTYARMMFIYTFQSKSKVPVLGSSFTIREDYVDIEEVVSHSDFKKCQHSGKQVKKKVDGGYLVTSYRGKLSVSDLIDMNPNSL